jgi:phospholipase A1
MTIDSSRTSRFAGFLLSIAMLTFSTCLAASSALQDRKDQEKKWMDEGLVILPHRPTYFLPFAYNTNPNNEPYKAAGEPDLDNAEVKFQISFKAPLVRSFFSDDAQLYFAYTQLVFWQLYNKEFSSPFRDTNYEPELFVNLDTDKTLGPLTNRAIQFGAVHQSNGRAEPLSRSWNRLYAQFLLERGDFLIAIKPWYRIKEPSEEDNNPDINKYMGYGEIRLATKWKKNVFAALIRNNLNFSENKGALELDWSYPLTKSLKSYLQYFNGYGECLLDYNHYNNRIGVGIALTDWL